ncbi:nucleotide sugar dehydrogenase [Candidatus Clostridium radicumherbarum]|uniref:Nucleotide sugar dehydrogenase n=1 Tax=Candidatus Clostridium radicumherbarum TaxID=3381662 RepID=A0ABW8TP74_9CLOT
MENINIVDFHFMNSLIDSSNKKVRDERVCVIGQGFVGLPLALSFALRGCGTIGVDVEETLISQINAGITSHTEKFHEMSIEKVLKLQLEANRYIATTNADMAIQNSNVIIVTVGIPIEEGIHKMDYLENACRIIGKNINKNSLIIIRSTVIPGTTEELILPIIEEESNMKAGKDFYLAYASERIAEGLAFEEFENMPTLVGAVDEESLNRAAKVLAIVCKAEIVRASCIKAVETSKVFENVQRDVNLAMSQEFARFSEAMGVDIFEVIKLANTHKRVNLLVPGAGVGGYCIPNAYYYLLPKAKEYEVELEMVKLARDTNSNMPLFIVSKVKELLNIEGKKLESSKIAVLGLAMKDYSNDDRLSPPIEICKRLINLGAEVRAYDPVITTEYDFKVKSQEEALGNADALIILTKQKEIKYYTFEHLTKVMAKKAVYVDCKGVLNMKEAKKHGINYWRI